MNIYAFGPIAAALDGAYSVVQYLAAALVPLAGANAAALAVVLITILVRLALIPVGLSQARAQRMRRRLAPRLAELHRLHGSNPERLQRETMALYAAENASPLAGCLPLLIQAPILSLIYGLFLLPTINGHPNELLGHTFAGAPLGTSFATAVSSGADPIGVLVGAVILALIAGIALLSRRQGLRATSLTVGAVPPSGVGGAGGGRAGGAGSAGSSGSSGGAGGSGRVGGAGGSGRAGGVGGTGGRGLTGGGGGAGGTGGRAGGAGGAGGADAGAGVLAAFTPGGAAASILSWLPLITVVFASFVPLAASLYLLVTLSWTFGEREILRRIIV
ncbi:YidC/Oxa1 family membrane protein insertase [Herbiconiux sp. CPCC 205763]|uniref:Membrane protein insertase YidC n=1 Tax=Herbiconiux aconitum TaxID=2970913 RepID=A0ABT2GRQ0_9MICO|nr:YidC/Oxa1 family membrane protein insertase [Herbiconiux aconitum]MCS5718901.1 YidC/Oxa1 family membrane protein insertase [Herbiconiux aconitum]